MSACDLLYLWHTFPMQMSVTTYIVGTSPVHRLDARVKIILLIVYSVCLFFVDTWVGMVCMALIYFCAHVVSAIPFSRVFGLVIPVYVLAALVIVFNMFVFATPDVVDQARVAAAEGTFSGVYPLIGSFSFTLSGFFRGIFYAVRILLLVFTCLVVTFTSTSTELTDALNCFLHPLHRFGVPTDDIAMVFSIALRFIPVTAEEFCRVRDAQWSRGSKFGEGSIISRLSAWQTVLIPLFVGLFRRADTLAQAMDARCYGMPGVKRTSISHKKLGVSSIGVGIAGCALCIAIAVLL